MIFFDHEKIKQLREYEGLNQKEFADRLDVTVPTISRWENGERIPQVTYISTMCNVFKVKIEYFFRKM